MKSFDQMERYAKELNLWAIIAIVIAVVFVGGLMALGWYKFFGPKFEGARREVFESTRSYNQGKLQELAKIRHEYIFTQDEGSKKVLEGVIRHKFADYDSRKLPPGLKSFLEEVRGY